MERWLETFARANFRRSADTAHDLKTPLNVAVLNLELLRMRLRKIAGEDEKIDAYTAAIETELRRLGHIFDAFFLLSTPPKNDEVPSRVDLVAVATDAASSAGYVIECKQPAVIHAHETRIRQAWKLFIDSAPKIVRAEDRKFVVSQDDSTFAVGISGTPDVTEGLELTKLFKLYYTDPQGNPDLSLAVARLIAETYGGELNALEDRDKVSLRFSFPLGER
ncbi:MAG TPA: histidine kinase dimerization/phospho-acceptor domain-containing protein [Thermoanaerobaculia bacterium]|nr:histidine kinase dimerization/phospho-acceptor domain-containing protein [Thermoanaerobaculia bacterium]